MRGLWGFTLAYAVALAWLAPVLPLTLDEILTLVGAVQPNTDALLQYVNTVAGGTPLAFWLPRWSMELLGASAFSGRFPSLLAATAACPAVYLLARRMGVRTPLLAVAVFALWPLQVRYALEARPYAFALACSVWSTELLLSAIEKPSGNRAALYVAVTALAALSQPYALFVTAAQIVGTYRTKGAWRIPAAGLVAATLLLAPWYLRYREAWNRVTGDQRLGSDLHSPLVFAHEIAGSGYAGAALLFAGVALGLRALSRERRFWAACAALPLAAVFVANHFLNYFFAIRQTIFVLPVLALLFARAGSRVLTVAFLGVSLYMDAAWFRKPREDWQAAADAVQRQLAGGGCVKFLGDSTPVYLYFHPEMAAHGCAAAPERVILAISPYEENTDYPPAAVEMGELGLTLRGKDSFNGPRVEVFSK